MAISCDADQSQMKSMDPNVAGRKKYERMWVITAEIIRKWDPYNLLAGGAPADELDHEIASLVAEIPRMKLAADAVNAVSRIFGSNFESSPLPLESCEGVGNKLFAALKAQDLLT